MEFKPNEKLFRAVLPKNMVRKENGLITSSTFKQSTGVSVDRQSERDTSECIEFMLNHIDERYLAVGGGIVSVTVNDCESLDLSVKYLPIENNEYNSEIHNNNHSKPLVITTPKARKLVKLCIIEHEIKENTCTINYTY